MKTENKSFSWLLPVALVVAALIVAVAINMPGISQTDTGTDKTTSPVVVSMPANLEQRNQTVGNPYAVAVPDGKISFATDETGQKYRLVTVNGSVTKSVTPDQADITVSVETLNTKASVSQSENAEIAEKVRAALKAAGIADADIKTVSYNLYEDFKWNQGTQQSDSIGYRTVNSIQVTVHDLSKTGDVIDAATQSGANRISSVSFSLSKGKQDEINTQALKEASANAKAKADSISQGLNITLGQVYSVNESGGYVQPYYYRSYDSYAMGASESAAPKASTPITPGDVEFTVSVNVQFEIQ